MVFERALERHRERIRPQKPEPAILGAFINGTFQFSVATNPALAYVRHLDQTATTAKHRNRVDLTLDPTDADNQTIPIAIYYDEYGDLAIWGLEPNQAGASLETDPTKGAGGVKRVIAGSGVTVDNTDPTRPIINAPGGGGGGGGAGTLFVLTDQPLIYNTTSETTLLGAGFGSLTLPIGWFSNGRGFRVRVYGAVNSKASAPGTLFIHLTIGGDEVYQLGSVTLPNGFTGTGYIDLELTCIDDSTPTSIQVRANGLAHYADGAFPISILEWMNGGGNTGIDGTITNAIDLTATFSVADNANTINVYGAVFSEIPAP